MALVDIEQWRTERGFNGPGGPGAGQGVQEGPAAAAPDLSSHVAALETEISRQADLIRALQSALQTYVDREEQARLAGLAAARKPKVARVTRRPRSPKPPPKAA